MQLASSERACDSEQFDTNIITIMQSFEYQQDFEKVVAKLDVPDASKPPNDKRVQEISERQCQEALTTAVPYYQPPIEVVYRKWDLIDPSNRLLSPVQLFLLFFQPILDLLLFHTNVAAQRDSTSKYPWKPLILTEMRCWLACRVEAIKFAPIRADLQEFWSTDALSTRNLGYHRFKAIERYLCLESRLEDPKGELHWHWRVKTAVDILRSRLQAILIPGSHFCVDESALKFHGRKTDKFKLAHKPAKEGFICYTLASHGGLIHDFVVASSQQGIEGIPQGITIHLPTRSLRKRKRADTGMSATEIHLPPIKATVYALCDRVTTKYRTQTFACFVDNLFVDVHLAQALLQLNIGICGTTRKNAPGMPPILLAIQHKYPQLLAENAVISRPVKNLVNCLVWKDSLRNNLVSFISTIHRSTDSQLVQRRSVHHHPTRTTQSGFSTVAVHQPLVAIDYNTYMGATDHANHLRATATVRRPGARKWTKKFLDFIIDVCHTNAFIIWRDHQEQNRLERSDRATFLQELVDGLVHTRDHPHTPSQLQKRVYCRWGSCQPKEYCRREPLQEVQNLAMPSRGRKTTDYCEICMKALCVGSGCFTAYHKAKRLPTR